MLVSKSRPEKIQNHQWWCEQRYSDGSLVGAVLIEREMAAPMREIAEEAAEYFDRGQDNDVICVIVTSSIRREIHNVKAHRSKTWEAELSSGETFP